MSISSLYHKNTTQKIVNPTPNTAPTIFEPSLDTELTNLPSILNQKLTLPFFEETIDITAPSELFNISQALENIQEEVVVQSFDQSVYFSEMRASPSHSQTPKKKFTLRLENDLKFEPETITKKISQKIDFLFNDEISVIPQIEHHNSIVVENTSKLTASLFSSDDQRLSSEGKQTNLSSIKEQEDKSLVQLLRKQQELIQIMRSRGFDGFMLMPPSQTGSKIGFYNGINFLDIKAPNSEITQESSPSEKESCDRSSGEHAIKQKEDLIHDLIQETTLKSKRFVHRPRSRIMRGLCFCKNSKCVKLYCECFKQAKYCKGCNCEDCENTPAHHDNFTENSEDPPIKSNRRTRRTKKEMIADRIDREHEEMLGKRQYGGFRNVRTRRKCSKNF